MTERSRRPRVHAVVKILYVLSVAVCLALAYWSVTNWVPRLGWPGVVWTVFVLGIAAHNTYFVFVILRRHTSPTGTPGDTHR